MSTENCYVKFYKDYDEEGDHYTFNGPINVPDLGDNYYYDGQSSKNKNGLDDSISSLVTGSQSWITVYSKHNYSGSSVSFGPGKTVNNLGDNNMNDTIVSFKLFDAEPVDINQVVTNFLNLYSGANQVSKISGECIEFYAADSHYRIYYPTIEQSGDVVSFRLNIDHDKGGGDDDNAVITFSMDTSGKFIADDSMSITYEMSSGAYHVPDWAIKFIDDGIDELAEEAIVYLDGAEIVLTAGIGTELVIPTDILILAGAEVLTTMVNHINGVIDKLFGLSDDGGTMYYSPVISHAIMRTVFAYYQERYASNSGSLVTYDDNAFLEYFSSTTTWHTDKNTAHLDFDYPGESGKFRVYQPDNSSGYSKAGLMSSTKIDAINDNSKDDHLILVSMFDATGKLMSVQGSIDIYGAPDDSDDEDSYVAPSTGTITYNQDGQMVQILKDSTVNIDYNSLDDAYKDIMQSALDNVDYVDTSNFSDSLKSLVKASHTVLDATKAAIKV